ncbi:MAG TPA: hypothetical protein VMF90_03625 [Rhizobiaceae bacterium]|nr:hypothetical protein [Rhizobiaceae bacterium]
MSCYLRVVQTETEPSTEAWDITDDEAVRIDVSNPKGGPGTYFKAESGETIWDAIRRMTPWFEPDGKCPFHKTRLNPGEYNRRIARPTEQHSNGAPDRNPGVQDEIDFVANMRGQLTVLVRQLSRICQTVQPVPANFSSFGHDVRNLLILACTEVESHWRGVLVANGKQGDRFTTLDYVLLKDAMHLDEYAVTFPNYPWLPSVKPFAGWGSTGAPTQELKWYDAYNAVKHNRETEFARATLGHAFDAVSACAIMLAAQFGLSDGLGERSEVRDFFAISAPRWPWSEVYISPYGRGSEGWNAVPYPFRIKS